MNTLQEEINSIISRDFNLSIAKDIGERAAIILHNLIYWVEINRTQNKKDHFYDNKWWTYQTINGFESLYPYLTYEQIKYALEVLEKNGYILKDNFNKSKYDKTTWYAITEKTANIYNIKSLREISLIEQGTIPHRTEEDPSPIPDLNPDLNPDSKLTLKTYSKTENDTELNPDLSLLTEKYSKEKKPSMNTPNWNTQKKYPEKPKKKGVDATNIV